MNVIIEWRESAESEFLDAISYVSGRNPVAAENLYEQILDKVEGLKANPGLYQESDRWPGYRQITTKRFYILLYKAIDRDGCIIVDIADFVHSRQE